MGNKHQVHLKKTSSQFIIACLNYSGVQESPYEYYEYQAEDQKQINSIFQEICNQYVKGFQNPKFKWIMGKIDKDWHTRLSPLYNQKCGTKANGKMMTIAEFEEEWNRLAKEDFPQYEDKVYGKLPNEEREKVKYVQLEQCMHFDLAVYRSLLKLIYKIDNFNEIDLDSKPFLEYQRRKFSKSFLSRQLKERKTLEILKSTEIDIFFFQEADIQIIEEIGKKFDNFHLVDRIHANCTSIIFFRKDICPEIKDFRLANEHFCKEYYKRTGSNPEIDLYWNDDTVFQVLTHHILISAHLTSKKQINQKQIQYMKQSLTKLKRYFPQYEIIIGGDLNGNLDYGFQISPTEDKPVTINVFPDLKKDSTVNKKRTLMQAQKHKANKYIDEVKDYFVTTQKFTYATVMTINGIEIEKGKQMPLLPNSEHPYDHYLLLGKVKK